MVTDIQAQLAEIGINVTLDLQESTTFIDNTSAGTVPFFLLGWGADFPDPTNFMDYHFTGAFKGLGTPFPDLVDVLRQAGQTTDEAARADLYAQANALIQQHIPLVPIAYGGSAMGYRADVVGAHASPLTSERLSVMQAGDRDQFVFVQNGEPGGLYCADETDGESLRVCEQIVEPLLQYETGETDVGAGAGRELGVQRRPDRVDVPPPPGRHVLRRLGVRRHRRDRELPRAVGRRRSAPRRP